MTQDNTTSLAQLVAAPEDVPVGTVKLSIKPLGWYESVAAVKAIAPALAVMPDVPANGGNLDVQAWLIWLSECRDDVVQFLCLSTGFAAEQIQPLPPMSLIELLFGVMELNADFFIKSLPAAVAGVASRATALMDRVKAIDLGSMTKPGSSTTGSTSSSVATATPT